MSNPDSFIDEVTEAVRRDRLFALMRRYGWIAVVLVLLTVGGTAWTEWSKAQERARAEAFGDAVLSAFDGADPTAHREALSAVPATGGQTAILNLLLASDPRDDRAASIAALEKIIADNTAPQVYRDLATLKRVILTGADQPLAERRTALDGIAAPGRAFRTLAQEQLAYLLVEEGRTEDAITALKALAQDQEAPEGLRQRVTDMIVALGGSPGDEQAG